MPIYWLSCYATLYTLHTLTRRFNNVHVYHTCIETLSLAICTFLYSQDAANTCFHYIWCVARYTYVLRVEPTSTSSALHHIATLLLLIMSFYTGVHQFALNSLILTSVSTPFLAASKMLRAQNREKEALYVFIPFAILFTISRIIVFPLVICWPMYKLNTPPIIWITSNIAINCLWGIQWYWLYNICGIMSKKLGNLYKGIGYSAGI